MEAINSNDLQRVVASRALRATVRAYVLGHISTTGPRLLRLIAKTLNHRLSLNSASDQVLCLFAQQSAINRFPTFCAAVVGGTLYFQWLCGAIVVLLYRKNYLNKSRLNQAAVERLSRFSSSFVAALIAISMLNRPSAEQPSRKPIPLEDISPSPGTGLPRSSGRRSSVRLSNETNGIVAQPVPQNVPSGVPVVAGKTLTLTTFAVVRAVEVVVRWSWVTRQAKHIRAKPQTARKSLLLRLEKLADPAVFAISCSVVMWSWFYSPERLPKAYNGWISSVAQIDTRLLQALREVRKGNFVYGKDTGIAPLLGSLSQDIGRPFEWGDPVKTIPVPCELVHTGTGRSCEWHAIVRFARAWSTAMKMYLPLNMVLLWRTKPLRRAVARVLIDASRSSAFLGTFAALFYYGVCIARTRLGPKIFSSKVVTPIMWEGGLGVATGCAVCGWSIFIEKSSRRQEMAFFVAPKALATLLPQRYDRKHVWAEQMLFATSTAVVLTAAQENSRYVRGVLGRLLQRVLS